MALGHIHKANYNNNENNFIYPGSLISFGFDELGEHGILDIKINKKNSEKNKINNLNNLNNNFNLNNNYEKNINNSENKNNYLENNSNILNNLENKNNYLENNLNNLENKNNYLINNLKNEKITEKYFIKIENSVFEEKIIDIKNENSEEDIIEKIQEEKFDDTKFYKIVLEGNKKIEFNPKTICKLVGQKNILKVKDETKIDYEIDKLIEQKNLKGMFVKNILKQIEENPEEKNKLEEALKIGLKMFD